MRGDFDLQRTESMVNALIGRLSSAIDAACSAADHVSVIQTRLAALAEKPYAQANEQYQQQAAGSSLGQAQEAQARAMSTVAETEKALRHCESQTQDFLKQQQSNLQTMRSQGRALAANARARFREGEQGLLRDIQLCQGILQRIAEALDRAQRVTANAPYDPWVTSSKLEEMVAGVAVVGPSTRGAPSYASASVLDEQISRCDAARYHILSKLWGGEYRSPYLGSSGDDRAVSLYEKVEMGGGRFGERGRAAYKVSLPAGYQRVFGGGYPLLGDQGLYSTPSQSRGSRNSGHRPWSGMAFLGVW